MIVRVGVATPLLAELPCQLLLPLACCQVLCVRGLAEVEGVVGVMPPAPNINGVPGTLDVSELKALSDDTEMLPLRLRLAVRLAEPALARQSTRRS